MKRAKNEEKIVEIILILYIFSGVLFLIGVIFDGFNMKFVSILLLLGSVLLILVAILLGIYYEI